MIRILDVILSVVALMLILPLFILISITLKFTGEGYVFATQKELV